MDDAHDILSPLAPMLRVRPELQDFCQFGGNWRASHAPEDSGWASFHIVTKGSCSIVRLGEKPIDLDAGDVLLLPHGDGHVVYGQGRDRSSEYRDISITYRDHIRFKQTAGAESDTELVCGRLHLESSTENLLLRALPQAIVLRLGGMQQCSTLVAMIREELQGGRAGAATIARDLASALFVMLLRQHLEVDPPVTGLLALLAARETSRAVAAILREPARQWELQELATTAAVSRATLIRSFRRICGLPPQAFITEVRLSLARNRLTHTSDPLSSIASDVGYQSEAALSRAFLRRFQIRPGAARLEAQEGAIPTAR
jgi:AraC family transcriptional regulator, activator of mtrCDE